MNYKPFRSPYSRSDREDKYVNFDSIVEVVRLTDSGFNGLANNVGAYLICDCRGNEQNHVFPIDLQRPYLLVDIEDFANAQYFADEALNLGLKGLELIAYVEEELKTLAEIIEQSEDTRGSVSGVNAEEWLEYGKNVQAAE